MWKECFLYLLSPRAQRKVFPSSELPASTRLPHTLRITLVPPDWQVKPHLPVMRVAIVEVRRVEIKGLSPPVRSAVFDSIIDGTSGHNDHN